jgi:hypothetical protein
MTDVRSIIVEWARWGVDNHLHFNYTEDMNRRMSAVSVWPPKFPIYSDCSAAVTLWYWYAGAADPNGNHYNGYGYTGTLLSHGTHIPLAQVVPGDVVVYGPGTGWHTALVVEVHGQDVLTISHGQQGDPSYVWVNPPHSTPSNGYTSDGRLPQTYLRFNTAAVNTIHKPSDLLPHPAPTPTLPAPTPSRPTNKLGDKGANVNYCQTLLNKKGIFVVVDSIFGTATDQAVRKFQAIAHLTIDGIVGPQTWKALGA